MRDQDVNLLPASARERVLQAREMSRSCRAAMVLVALATVAAVGAEFGRQESARHFDQVDAKHQGVHARDEHRRRLEAEVDALTGRVQAMRGADRELPLLPLLGAVARALPAGTRLERFAARNASGEARGELTMVGSVAQFEHVMNALSAVPPFANLEARDLTAIDPVNVRRATFALVGGRRFQVVYDDADVQAETIEEHDEPEVIIDFD